MNSPSTALYTRAPVKNRVRMRGTEPNPGATAHAITVEVTTDSPGLSQRADTCQVNRRVELLTREGCMICSGAATRLKQLADELGFELAVTDVDAVAAAGDSALRAEFGDRLPVVLLDGAEHSYWEVDEPRLRADLARG